MEYKALVFSLNEVNNSVKPVSLSVARNSAVLKHMPGVETLPGRPLGTM